MTSPTTWFITGASQGLGLALVRAVLADGHRVMATTRGDELPLRHDRLTVCRLDVRDRDACRAAITRTLGEHGRLDVLVNNAGYGLVGAIEEVGEREARGILDVDLLGPLWLTQAALPVMREQGSGHVVQISSVGGVGAAPFFGLYNAAKWGLEGFSEALAAEARSFGIRVTLAEVGAMDTEWATGAMQFARPLAAYDSAREEALGTAIVPWASEPGATGGGTDPAEVAQSLLRVVADPEDTPLRVLLGDDAPGQVAEVMRRRSRDYGADARYEAD